MSASRIFTGILTSLDIGSMITNTWDNALSEKGRFRVPIRSFRPTGQCPGKWDRQCKKVVCISLVPHECLKKTVVIKNMYYSITRIYINDNALLYVYAYLFIAQIKSCQFCFIKYFWNLQICTYLHILLFRCSVFNAAKE